MKALTISDQDNMIMALQDEIRRNDVSRYDHRLHGVLLVAQGMTCPRVAEILGDSPRTVVNVSLLNRVRSHHERSDIHPLTLPVAHGKLTGPHVSFFAAWRAAASSI